MAVHTIGIQKKGCSGRRSGSNRRMKSVEQWQSSGGGLVVGGALHHGVVVMVVVVVWVEGVAKEVISGSSIHSPCHDKARKHIPSSKEV